MPTDSNRTADRRRFLKLTGGAALATTLAGCSGDGGDGDGGTDGGDGSDGGTDGGDGSDGGTDGSDGEDGGDGGSDYPSDDLRWVIPYSTGGGFDAYSRAISEFMPEHLPGDVDVIPENLPGAGGRQGANEVYRSDDPHTVGIFNVPGFIATQLVQDTEYDLSEISWFGRIAAANYVLYTNVDSGLETLQDLQEADSVSFAATDFSGTAGLTALIGSQVLEINADFVTGYDGSSEARTGVIRGDADARMGTWSNLRQLIEDGEVNGVISLTQDPPEWAPDMPTVAEEGYEEAIIGLQRLCGASPAAGDEEVQILGDALEETANSDEMQEWAENNDRPINHAGPEETQTILENNISAFEEYRDLLEENIG